MNVFGKNGRGWRKAKKRGVSPIIATILLVAITVVLAAVLYVLISGLTHGPGNAPLGTTYGFGSATQQTSPATGAPAWCAASHQCWEVSISSASGPTISELSFIVKYSTNGTAVPFVGLKISIVNLAQTQSAYTTNGASTWVTTGGLASSTAVSPTMEIWVDSGTTAGAFGQGWSITAYGSGSYTGSVGPLTLP